MSPTIRGALKHAVFLGFVSVALLSVAVLGGGGCPPADAAASTRKDRNHASGPIRRASPQSTTSPTAMTAKAT